MAERRMISKKVVDTDLFLDMPVSTRLLYYDLSVRADDDGFVASPKRITRMVGCSEDDLKLLVAKGYLIPFESGVCVIRDWKVHNYIPKDRYHETDYREEKSMLTESETGVYSLNGKNTACLCDLSSPVYNTDTVCIQDVSSTEYKPYTEDRLGKDRLGKDRLGKDRLGKDRLNREGDQDPERKRSTTARFIKPTVEEVRAYCRERNNNVDAERFVDYYEANGWKVGKSSMKDWKATVRNWERRDKDGRQTSKGTDKNKDRAGAIDLSHIGTVI